MSEEQKAHSVFGASSAKRWTNCPGSVALCEQVPKPPDSEYAAEGTAAHMLAEKVLQAPPNAFYYVGREKINGFEVTEEMATHVQEYVDYVRNIRNETGGELLIEQRFHLKHLHPDFFGTCDAVVMQPFGELHVLDFKYGAGVAVEVEDNDQMKFYGLGAMELGDFTSITLHVCQPRAHHEDGGYRTWKTTPEELLEFGKYLKIKALEARKPNAPLQEGDWCRWCAAAAVCPKLYKKAVQTAQSDFAEPKLPVVEKLTHEQISKVLEHRKLIESWFKSVEDYALQSLMAGEKIAGLKLVSRRSSREWINDEIAKEALVGKLGEGAFEKKLLSVAKAEKACGKDFVVGLFQTVDGGLTVAPESDRRKSLPTAQDDFKEVPQTPAPKRKEITISKAKSEVSEEDF